MDITALPSWLIAIILTALFVASLEAGGEPGKGAAPPRLQRP